MSVECLILIIYRSAWKIASSEDGFHIPKRALKRRGRGGEKKTLRPAEDEWSCTQETDEIASAGGKLRRVSEEVMKRR